ncbi:MAG: thermonuclease family protein [Candidatus Margulisiibacteriota bacterium]
MIVLLSGFGSAPPQDTYQVDRVYDGDTVRLTNGEKVRYIGIDTPEFGKEFEYFGKEAAQANRRLVSGKRVRLEYDQELRDKYGRLLAYVYVDDIFVNAWLVENGYAQIMTIPPNVKYKDLFLKLRKEAREEGRGMWGKD